MPLDGSRVRPAFPGRNPMVKSATRVLEILEFFDYERGPTTARKLAQALGYPQSSTAALLHSLVASGHLRHDARARTYLPSLRVAMLGSGWLAPRLCGEGSLPELVRDVAERSGLATGLLIRNAHHAESILSVPPAHSRLPRLPSRCRQDLVAPGPARALLSRCSEAELRQLLHRRNAEAGASGQVVLKVQDLLPCIAMLRRQGWLAAVDFAAPDLLQLAVPLHGAWASETLALVVALEASSRPGEVAEVARLVLERRAVRIPAALAPPFARHLGLQSWHTNERYQAEG